MATRQRRHEQQKIAAGLCATCTLPRVTSKHCRRHADEQAARDRKARLAKKAALAIATDRL